MITIQLIENAQQETTKKNNNKHSKTNECDKTNMIQIYFD